MNSSRGNKKLEVFLRFAEEISTLSTCDRKHVGAVVTNKSLTRVYAIGYNGNAAGEPNHCDRDEPGRCGCLHAEVNALVKCQVSDKDKVMFLTLRPCITCSKLIVNSGFSSVFYRENYRLEDGAAELLTRRGIECLQLTGGTE
jgi:dCMP deaminase